MAEFIRTAEGTPLTTTATTVNSFSLDDENPVRPHAKSKRPPVERDARPLDDQQDENEQSPHLSAKEYIRSKFPTPAPSIYSLRGLARKRSLPTAQVKYATVSVSGQSNTQTLAVSTVTTPQSAKNLLRIFEQASEDEHGVKKEERSTGEDLGVGRDGEGIGGGRKERKRKALALTVWDNEHDRRRADGVVVPTLETDDTKPVQAGKRAARAEQYDSGEEPGMSAQLSDSSAPWPIIFVTVDTPASVKASPLRLRPAGRQGERSATSRGVWTNGPSP